MNNSPPNYVDPTGLVAFDFKPESVSGMEYSVADLALGDAGYAAHREGVVCKCVPNDVWGVCCNFRCTVWMEDAILLSSRLPTARPRIYGHEQRHIIQRRDFVEKALIALLQPYEARLSPSPRQWCEVRKRGIEREAEELLADATREGILDEPPLADPIGAMPARAKDLPWSFR